MHQFLVVWVVLLKSNDLFITGESRPGPVPKRQHDDEKANPTSALESCVFSALQALKTAVRVHSVSAGILSETISGDFLESVLQSAMNDEREASDAKQARQAEYDDYKRQLEVARACELIQCCCTYLMLYSIHLCTLWLTDHNTVALLNIRQVN